VTITYAEFARDCCAALGANANESQQLDTLVTVFTLEDSHAAYNPEDTEEPEPGATDYNPEGVKDYPTLAEGLAAFRSTLENGDYPEIVKMLRAGDDASRVLACPEWDTWAGQPVTQDYAEVLAVVRNDRAAYYGRLIGEGADPSPAPSPAPAPHVPEPLPAPDPTGETMPEIDIFLSHCGLGELEYIYKRVAPLFEPKITPELVPPQIPTPPTTGGTFTPSTVTTPLINTEATTAPLAEETTQ
jgi:hypothetical protein